MVGIIYESNNNKHVCNGVIVAKNKVVTAARCLINAQSVTLAFATINIDEPYYAVDIDGDEIIIHRYYARIASSNDIAMIQLKKALKFGPKIDKIDTMINQNYLVRCGTDVIVLSYSESDDPNRSYLDTHLRYINGTVVNLRLCREMGSMWVLDEKQQICVRIRDDKSNAIFSGGMNLKYFSDDNFLL